MAEAVTLCGTAFCRGIHTLKGWNFREFFLPVFLPPSYSSSLFSPSLSTYHIACLHSFLPSFLSSHLSSSFLSPTLLFFPFWLPFFHYLLLKHSYLFKNKAIHLENMKHVHTQKNPQCF